VKFHFIGIGGVGMSALARILIEKGHEVSGSDLKKSYVTSGLFDAGARIFCGHRKENIEEGQIVVYSTAIKPDNPEWLAAKQNKCMHRSELLEELLSEKDPILVVGAHGKTSTTSLLSYICEVAGFDPSFVIGGFSPSLQGINGKFGKGNYFIAEGDESDGSFLRARPYGAIITNVDFDHLDFWKTEDALLEAYQNFIKGAIRKELLFYWNVDGVSYGFEEGALCRALNIRFKGGKQFFDVNFQGVSYRDIELNMLGKHNVLNALASFGMAISIGCGLMEIRKALKSFKGVKRRLEWKGDLKGASIFDDYAHHPKEIESTLEAVKEAFSERRKVVIFQPHRYSRMKDFIDDFIKLSVWKDSDELIVTDIFSAGEDEIEGITTDAFLKRLEKKATYIPRENITEFIKRFILPNDIVITLGAGDITEVGAELVYEPG
jgi:UDP-N-acetylmuramate--alanine ligase